jgi:hypothetical protein
MPELAGLEESPTRPRTLDANQTQRKGGKQSETQMLKDDEKQAPPIAHHIELQKHGCKHVQSARVQGCQCP